MMSTRVHPFLLISNYKHEPYFNLFGVIILFDKYYMFWGKDLIVFKNLKI